MIGGLLICFGAPLVLIGQQFRQEALDVDLIQAIKKVDAPTVNRLLSEGASANARDMKEQRVTIRTLLTHLLARLQHKPEPVAEGRTDPALLLLITDDRLYFGREDREVVDGIAAALVLHKANIHVLGYRQETPLADAAAYGLHHTLQLLLSKGAEVNTHDDFGLTPLMGADEYAAHLLLQHGADVNATDAQGLSALYYATLDSRTPGKRTILHILKQHGARLNKKDKQALARDSGT